MRLEVWKESKKRLHVVPFYAHSLSRSNRIWYAWFMTPLKRAVFLDRDGTINIDPGYINHPDQMSLIPGAGAALRKMSDLGLELVIVSNQSGVGRGIISPPMIPLIHERLNELLKADGVQLKHFSLCFHRPEEDCECRKPKSALLIKASQDLGIDLRLSYMVGDKVADLQAGEAAGCHGKILVRTGYGETEEKKLPPGLASFVAPSLPQVADWIEAQETSRS